MPTPNRRTALVAGVCYLVTFAASIPALILIGPVLHQPGYVLGTGADDARVTLGALLDVVNALACIGTAVVLYPVLRRVQEAAALGFVASRLLEAATIMIGVVCVLAVLTLRRDATAGAPEAAALIAVRNWTFLLGPGLMPVFNALLLGSLLYRGRLVPRLIPLIGLAGAPLLLADTLAVLFGALDQVSPLSGLATLPIAAWELAVGVYLTVKGLRLTPAR